MKRIIAITLTLLLALGLCACGGAEDANKGMYGTYTLYAMDYDEHNVMLAEDFFEGQNYITLKSGGSAVMCLEDEKADVKWKADGEKLVLTAPDGDMDATLKDGILALMADDIRLYFVGESGSKASLKARTLEEILTGEPEPASEAPVEPATEEPATNGPEPQPPATEAPALTEVQAMWNGWWYGCADINGCEKGWEWANGETFDVAMYVELDADGYGTLGIYDPYTEIAMGPNNNRFITINCHADLRYLYGDSGTTFGYDINPSDWVVVHNLDNPDKLNVGSSHVDNDGNKMGYDFTFLPWGDRWESETYQRFIPHFDDYLAMLDQGMRNPFDTGEGGEETPTTPTEPSNPSGGLSSLLGSNPARLDINGKGAVYVYYPADQFAYDADYGKLRNSDTGVGILIDPMLGSTNLAEIKASYEEHNSDEDDYSLVETTRNGYQALIMTYSDWLGSTLRVDLDFGGNHDGFYGMSFAVSGNSLEDCDSDLVWAIIDSMEVVK